MSSSPFKKALESGKFVVTSEVAPPKGTNLEKMVHHIELLKDKVGTHFDPHVFEAFMDSYCEIEQAKDNINNESNSDKLEKNKINLESTIF